VIVFQLPSGQRGRLPNVCAQPRAFSHVGCSALLGGSCSGARCAMHRMIVLPSIGAPQRCV
jgi:hypothetical protein